MTSSALERDLLELLDALAIGKGDSRTGELARRGWLRWEVTREGLEAVTAWRRLRSKCTDSPLATRIRYCPICGEEVGHSGCTVVALAQWHSTLLAGRCAAAGEWTEPGELAGPADDA